MAAPVFVLSETNGAGAVVTDNVPTIAYASIDAASTASLSGANAIPQGGYSFEKYHRFKVTSAAPNSISNAGIAFSPTAVTDSAASSATVGVKYGVGVTYATPVATASSVATASVTGDTGTPGTTITAPANSAGSYTPYFVTQLQSIGATAGGNLVFPNPFLYFNYTWA